MKGFKSPKKFVLAALTQQMRSGNGWKIIWDKIWIYYIVLTIPYTIYTLWQIIRITTRKK